MSISSGRKDDTTKGPRVYNSGKDRKTSGSSEASMFTCERATTCKFREGKHSMRPAVSYIRVSKPKQGRSGLGLEAQQATIKAFCAQHGYRIEAEYREVETGKGADALDRRFELAAAMKFARKLGKGGKAGNGGAAGAGGANARAMGQRRSAAGACAMFFIAPTGCAVRARGYRSRRWGRAQAGVMRSVIATTIGRSPIPIRRMPSSWALGRCQSPMHAKFWLPYLSIWLPPMTTWRLPFHSTLNI